MSYLPRGDGCCQMTCGVGRRLLNAWGIALPVMVLLDVIWLALIKVKQIITASFTRSMERICRKSVHRAAAALSSACRAIGAVLSGAGKCGEDRAQGQGADRDQGRGRFDHYVETVYD